MDTENNAMQMNPKHKLCMKKNQSKTQKLKIFQFRSIEHRSNTNRAKQILTKNCYRNFDRSRDRFDRSKIWKNQFFEKQSILMQKLLTSQCFMNKMHEYEMKSFQKPLNLTQIFQKQDFQSIFPQKLNHKTHFALRSRNF